MVASDDMLKQKIIFFGIIFLFLCNLSIFSLTEEENIEKYEKGLFFSSYESEKDKRTSLNLTPDKRFELKDGFSMSFDIQLRKEKYDYGYVFRIIANDSINLDFVSLSAAPAGDFFALTVGNKSVIRFKLNEFEPIDEDRWMKIAFWLKPQTNQLSLVIDGIEKDAHCRLQDLKSFDLFFGACTHPAFSTTDVRSMNVRNIRICNDDGKEIRFWELGKHGINAVYDSCVNAKAVALNPKWRIDSHIKWHKRLTLTIPGIDPQFAFDEENGTIFLVKEKSLFVYDVATASIDSIRVKKGLPYNTRANQLIYDSNRNVLVSYHFESDTLSEYSFESNEWSLNHTASISPVYWHHSKRFIAEDDLLLTVGGYGFNEYKKDILRYSFQEKKWGRLDGDSSRLISPRYLGSLGYWGNGELLYFGGFGNLSGYQEDAPKNYYDLFKINVKQNTIDKLWSLQGIDKQFVNSNSMIIDKKENVFYALTYPDKQFLTAIQLSKFGIDSPTRQIFADTIPYHFNDNESYSDLFFHRKTSQLIAVVSYSDSKKAHSIVEINSIQYPPLRKEDVLQKESTEKSPWYFLILPALLLAIGLIGWRSKKRTNQIRSIINDQRYPLEKGIFAPFDKRKTYHAPVYRKTPSSISLLGNFQVIDSQGEDITGSFTLVISQIFLLSFLSTIKNGKGVSSQDLKDFIWSDKDYANARNNRNVSISKLRVILKSVGNIEIVNNNDMWSVVCDDHIFCDYKNVFSLIRIIDSEKQTKKELLNELIDLASRGVLLPNVQREWIDNYKSEYSNLLIDKLLLFSKRDDVKNDLLLLLKISGIILMHDNIDEDGISLKCYALYHLGKKGQAKQSFEKFKEDIFTQSWKY